MILKGLVLYVKESRNFSIFINFQVFPTHEDAWTSMTLIYTWCLASVGWFWQATLPHLSELPSGARTAWSSENISISLRRSINSICSLISSYFHPHSSFSPELFYSVNESIIPNMPVRNLKVLIDPIFILYCKFILTPQHLPMLTLKCLESYPSVYSHCWCLRSGLQLSSPFS